MPKLVPNQQPTVSLSYRLAVIGEAPGEQEEQLEQPFVGGSGRLLMALLHEAGIIRSACLIGNCCQLRPPHNEISFFKKDGPEFKHGLARLAIDLQEFRPNAILLLGQTPLSHAGIPHPVTDFRGTIFRCTELSSSFHGYKCISTLHPAYVMRQRSETPLLRFDIARAKEEAVTSNLSLPVRSFEVENTAERLVENIRNILPGTLSSIDIEGYATTGITCISICTNPGHGFIVAPRDFASSEQVRIYQALKAFLENPSIPKVLQNGLYDAFVLWWKWKIVVRGIVHDTMLSGWEHFPELPKGLGTQTSIWTREPYYKSDRKVNDKLIHYRYCCTDSAVTLEIHQKHMEHMTPSAKEHYQFNIDLLAPTLYMEARGIRYDVQKAAERKAELQMQMLELQARINVSAGGALNVNSTPQMRKVFYEKLRFEPQYKKEKGRKTDKLTCDVDALLNLSRSYNESIIFDVLHYRKLDSQREQLNYTTDADGRMRCSYNIVGTETGRLSCYESPSGSGSNLTTIMKQNRDLFIADEGHWFFQCDLEGADGWTVAAHCAALGDDTMLLDYTHHPMIKPARVIAVMYQLQQSGDMQAAFAVNRMSRDALLAIIAKTSIPPWLYFACKRVQHGSNYKMKGRTMSAVIQKDSWNQQGTPIFILPKDCEALQHLYFSRYPGVARWQEKVRLDLLKSPTMSCASGHVRTFFGLPSDYETWKEALAHEPQANTTYATNRAMHNLYYDPSNRRERGLHIEPLHQVHDALCGQFPKEYLDTARLRIGAYFNNPIRVAGIDLTIPYEGHYGPSWIEKEGSL